MQAQSSVQPSIALSARQASNAYVIDTTRTRKTPINWTKIGKAREKNKYIQVGKNGADLALTGSMNMWKKYPDLIYAGEVSLVGTRDELYQVLSTLPVEVIAGVNQYMSPELINDIINRGYNAQNVHVATTEGGQRDNYLAEIDKIKSLALNREEKVPSFTLADLDRIHAHLPEVIAKLASKATKQINAVTGSGHSRSGGGRSTLAQRYAALAPGKFLDVSNMTENLTQASLKDRPGEGSGRAFVEGVNISSTKLEPYIMAVNAIGIPNAANVIEQFKLALLARQGNAAIPTTVQYTTTGRTAPTQQTVLQQQAPFQYATPAQFNPQLLQAGQFRSPLTTTGFAQPTATLNTIPSAVPGMTFVAPALQPQPQVNFQQLQPQPFGALPNLNALGALGNRSIVGSG